MFWALTSQLNKETYVFAARGINTCRSQGVDVLVRHTIIFSEIYFIELFDVFIYLFIASAERFLRVLLQLGVLFIVDQEMEPASL